MSTLEHEQTETMRKRWLIPVIGAAVVAAAFVVIILVVNARPSLASVAEDCGGVNAGILYGAGTLVVDPQTATPDTLMCVTDKLLTNQTDQYKVAAAADAGHDTELHLEGYQVLVVGTNAGPAVSFATK